MEKDETGLPGPNLHGVLGRRAAGAADFDYSAALRRRAAAGLSWSREALDAFLADPAGSVPGTTMSFPGMRDAAEREAVIEYLSR